MAGTRQILPGRSKVRVQFHRPLKVASGRGQILLLGVNHSAEIEQPGVVRMALEFLRDRCKGGVQLAGLDRLLNRNQHPFRVSARILGNR